MTFVSRKPPVSALASICFSSNGQLSFSLLHKFLITFLPTWRYLTTFSHFLIFQMKIEKIHFFQMFDFNGISTKRDLLHLDIWLERMLSGILFLLFCFFSDISWWSFFKGKKFWGNSFEIGSSDFLFGDLSDLSS